MKHGAGAGVHGDVTGHVGTAGRDNESVAFGVNPGKVNIFGNYSYRDDRRKRSGRDERSLAASSPTRMYLEANQIAVHPRAHLGTLGLSYQPDAKNTFDLTAEYFHRRPTRDGVSTIVSRDDAGATLTDFDRQQTGYETERETGVTAAFQHDFPKEERQVRVEANFSDSPQTEAAHFMEVWRTPTKPNPASDVVLRQNQNEGHLSLDYTDPFEPLSISGAIDRWGSSLY